LRKNGEAEPISGRGTSYYDASLRTLVSLSSPRRG